jgi:hypothetical protein
MSDAQPETINIYDGPGDDVYIIDEYGTDNYQTSELDGNDNTPAVRTRTNAAGVRKAHPGRTAGQKRHLNKNAAPADTAVPAADKAPAANKAPATGTINNEKNNLGTTPASYKLDKNYLDKNATTTPPTSGVTTIPAPAPTTAPPATTAPTQPAGTTPTAPATPTTPAATAPAATPAPAPITIDVK